MYGLDVSFTLALKFRRDYLASAQSTQDIQELKAPNRTISSASSADQISNSESSKVQTSGSIKNVKLSKMN